MDRSKNCGVLFCILAAVWDQFGNNYPFQARAPVKSIHILRSRRRYSFERFFDARLTCFSALFLMSSKLQELLFEVSFVPENVVRCLAHSENCANEIEKQKTSNAHCSRSATPWAKAWRISLNILRRLFDPHKE